MIILLSGTMLWADNTPVWMIPLRDAIYEQQLNIDGFRRLYNEARTAAQRELSGTALDLALSRCEYLIGRALQEADRNDEARTHYNEGLRLAVRALETSPSAQAWVMRASNLAQLCDLGPWTFTAANGLDVDRFAKNALTFNDRNAAAQYLVAARWVFAPAPFNNVRRGIDMMKAILENSDPEKDDLFLTYSAIGFGYLQRRQPNDARPWIQRALNIYPTSTFAAELLARAQ